MRMGDWGLACGHAVSSRRKRPSCQTQTFRCSDGFRASFVLGKLCAACRVTGVRARVADVEGVEDRLAIRLVAVPVGDPNPQDVLSLAGVRTSLATRRTPMNDLSTKRCRRLSSPHLVWCGRGGPLLSSVCVKARLVPNWSVRRIASCAGPSGCLALGERWSIGHLRFGQSLVSRLVLRS